MATIYVSNSTSNGYGLGDDSRSRATAASKSTPVLTVTRALAVALASDTIIVNDGTYSESAFLAPAVANLTINPETAYGATLQCSDNAAARVLHVPVGATGITLGRIILDARSINTSCLTTDSASVVNDVTLHGTRLLNGNTHAISALRLTRFTMDQGWSIVQGAASITGVRMPIAAVGASSTITITDGTVTIASSSGATVIGIQVTHNGAQPDRVTIARNTITVSSTDSAATLRGVYCSGAAVSFEATDNTVSFPTGVSAQVCQGIFAIGTASATIGRAFVLRNTISSSGASVPNGYGIAIGNDVDTIPAQGADTITNILVAQNRITGANHGIFIGWQSNGMVVQNRLDNVVIGLVDKHTPGGSIWSGNILSRVNSGNSALRSKGSTSPLFVNNLYIASAGYLGRFLYATDAGVSATYKGNIMVAVGVVPTVIVEAADTSTMVFSQNDYYTDLTLPAGAFNYQGTTYDTLAAWIAAKETDALSVNPRFQNASAENFQVQATSPMPRAGLLNDWNQRDSLSRTLSRIAPSPGV